MTSQDFAGEEVAALAARVLRMAEGYGLSSAATVSLLHLSENANFLLHDPLNGRKLVARVHRPGYHDERAVRSEIDWLLALRRDRVAEVAEPLATGDGRYLHELPNGPSRLVVVFRYLEGREPAPDAALPAWFAELGRLSARLHAHAKLWRRPDGFVRPVWDLDAMFGPAPLWGPWRAALGLTAEGERLIEHALAKIAAELVAYGRGSDRFGLIHADLRLANLLIDGDRLKLIDFDDCGFSWNVYDFAASVSFHEHRPEIPALLEAWLDGYRVVGPFGPADRAVIPALVMARRILLCAWIASHSEVPVAASLGADYTRQSLPLAEAYLAGRFLTD